MLILGDRAYYVQPEPFYAMSRVKIHIPQNFNSESQQLESKTETWQSPLCFIDIDEKQNIVHYHV